MNKEDITKKLEATEASLKRWQTRLKRAAGMVSDLDKRRRRYQLALLSADAPVIATVKVKVPKAEAIASMVEAVDANLATLASPGIETDHVSEPDLPDFLNRTLPAVEAAAAAARKQAEEPQLVEQLKARRAAKVAAEKRKMPLTGKAASEYIKRKK